MFSNFKQKLSLGWQIAKSRFSKPMPLNNPIDAHDTEMVKESEESKHGRQFNKQLQSRKNLAMRPHGPRCKDMFTCKDKDCFVYKPSKIVSKTIVSIIEKDGKKLIV